MVGRESGPPRIVFDRIRELLESIDSVELMRRALDTETGTLQAQAVRSLLPLATYRQINDSQSTDSALLAARDETLKLILLAKTDLV
jgi:hypothetical protein